MIGGHDVFHERQEITGEYVDVMYDSVRRKWPEMVAEAHTDIKDQTNVFFYKTANDKLLIDKMGVVEELEDAMLHAVFTRGEKGITFVVASDEPCETLDIAQQVYRDFLDHEARNTPDRLD